MRRLDNKIALVSGSGRGIGRAIALKLASDGARVVVNDLDAEPANDTVSAIEAAGGVAVSCIGSVTSEDFPSHFVQTAVDSFGGVDIIVNNAGFVWDSVIQKMTDEQWDSIVDVHLKAPFRILRAAQPIIAEAAKRAEAADERVPCRKVVNISSIAGLCGNPGQANYAAAKAGLSGLTKTLAKEWGRYNVTVNSVAFGLIETRMTESAADVNSTVRIGDKDMKVGINRELLESMLRTIPLRRAGTPTEAAGAVHLFCLPESDYISGQTIVCSGGLMI